MRYPKTILLILAASTAGFLFLRINAPPQAAAPAVAASGISVVEPAASPSVPVALIRGSEATDIPWTSRTPAAKRVRKIFPDPAWMTPDPVLKTGDRIELALFEDAIFDARISNVTRYAKGGVGMTAELENGKQGFVYLTYNDGKVRISIEVMGGADYAILYQSKTGSHYAVEVDPVDTQILGEADLCVPDAVGDTGTSDIPDFAADEISSAPEGSTIIDVMIVYTPAAKNWAETADSGITNTINIAMQKANTVHANSKTYVYLNLVHFEEVDYVETAIAADLTNLTFTGGSYSALDNVQTLRDQYKADLVCMFEYREDLGGVGWVLTDRNGLANYGFCVTAVQQSGGLTYTVAHEWGHNMGCHHAKQQTLQHGPTLWNNWSENTWSAGWQWLNGSMSYPYGECTVMTYMDFYRPGDFLYERVPYFSNPDILYPGTSTPVGSAADGNNVRTIREMRTVIANYRKAPDLDYDGLPNEWELQYFGSETNADPNATASNGLNTVLGTYIAGLNPTNPQSFFKMTADASGNGFVVNWDSITGRVYGVNWANNLTNSFQALETNIVWPQSSYTDTVHDADSHSFYKINIRLAP